MIWTLIIGVDCYLAYEVDRLRQRVAKLEAVGVG